MSKKEVKAITDELITHAIVLGSFVALMWCVEIADFLVFRGQLDTYGILPRNLIGLRGILFMPFLHGNFPHLIANTIPFIILGWLVMLRKISDFFVVTAVTMLVGGLGVWVFGSPGLHIGASGIIFGYLGFLLLRGLFQRSFGGILLSLVVGFLYGGLIWGVLPGQPGVSWEGHLFGFLGGVVAARLLSRR
ncbi:MAG: rhomboid family intramembrane serine protease [Geitlerinemataceae cyanobacterium]